MKMLEKQLAKSKDESSEGGKQDGRSPEKDDLAASPQDSADAAGGER